MASEEKEEQSKTNKKQNLEYSTIQQLLDLVLKIDVGKTYETK